MLTKAMDSIGLNSKIETLYAQKEEYTRIVNILSNAIDGYINNAKSKFEGAKECYESGYVTDGGNNSNAKIIENVYTEITSLSTSVDSLISNIQMEIRNCQNQIDNCTADLERLAEEETLADIINNEKERYN